MFDWVNAYAIYLQERESYIMNSKKEERKRVKTEDARSSVIELMGREAIGKQSISVLEDKIKSLSSQLDIKEKAIIDEDKFIIRTSKMLTDINKNCQGLISCYSKEIIEPAKLKSIASIVSCYYFYMAKMADQLTIKFMPIFNNIVAMYGFELPPNNKMWKVIHSNLRRVLIYSGIPQQNIIMNNIAVLKFSAVAQLLVPYIYDPMEIAIKYYKSKIFNKDKVIKFEIISPSEHTTQNYETVKEKGGYYILINPNNSLLDVVKSAIIERANQYHDMLKAYYNNPEHGFSESYLKTYQIVIISTQDVIPRDEQLMNVHSLL